MDKALCVADVLVTPLFLLLSVTAVASQVSSPLRDIASHGKTRVFNNEVENCKAGKGEGGRRWLDLLLHDDMFLVRKSLFLHFYITGIIVTVSLLLRKWTGRTQRILRDDHGFDRLKGDISESVATTLLLVHLARRCWECIFVHAWSRNGRMHVSGYFLGVVHYLLLPFVFISPRLRERDWCCAVVASTMLPLEVEGVDMDSNPLDPSLYVVAPRIVLGIVICVYGQYQQNVHHRILANLRDTSKKTRQTTIVPSSGGDYRIPSGRWFDFVACPHYLAEIIVYTSFFLLLYPDDSLPNYACASHRHVETWWSSLVEQALIFRPHKSTCLLLWVTVNLCVSASRNHAWYVDHSGPDPYPTTRKAIIPFFF